MAAESVDVKNKERREQDDGITGFATVDDRGRIALSKATRQALGLHAGSSLVYVVSNGAIMLLPQDEHLARLSEHAARVLENAGVTVEDILAELPAVRDEIMRETYGDEFMDALAREHAALHAQRDHPHHGE